MREIQTEMMINAPIEKIWTSLIDFSSYSTWNPFIRHIQGNPAVNEQLTITIKPPNKKPMIFRPKILSLAPYELTWMGHLWLPGIFDGIHRFALLPNADNTVRFMHSEKFSGFLHIPIFSLIAESTKKGFENMNMALKKRAESSS